jgi:hypothetical protein
MSSAVKKSGIPAYRLQKTKFAFKRGGFFQKYIWPAKNPNPEQEFWQNPILPVLIFFDNLSRLEMN